MAQPLRKHLSWALHPVFGASATLRSIERPSRRDAIPDRRQTGPTAPDRCFFRYGSAIHAPGRVRGPTLFASRPGRGPGLCGPCSLSGSESGVTTRNSHVAAEASLPFPLWDTADDRFWGNQAAQYPLESTLGCDRSKSVHDDRTGGQQNPVPGERCPRVMGTGSYLPFGPPARACIFDPRFLCKRPARFTLFRRGPIPASRFPVRALLLFFVPVAPRRSH